MFFRTPAFLASECLSVVEVPRLLLAVVVLAKEQIQGTLHQVICLVQKRAVGVNKALVRIVGLLLVAPQLRRMPLNDAAVALNTRLVLGLERAVQEKVKYRAQVSCERRDFAVLCPACPAPS